VMLGMFGPSAFVLGHGCDNFDDKVHRCFGRQSLLVGYKKIIGNNKKLIFTSRKLHAASSCFCFSSPHYVIYLNVAEGNGLKTKTAASDSAYLFKTDPCTS